MSDPKNAAPAPTTTNGVFSINPDTSAVTVSNTTSNPHSLAHDIAELFNRMLGLGEHAPVPAPGSTELDDAVGRAKAAAEQHGATV